MGLSNVARAQLAAEGLTTVQEFEEDQLDQAFKNMRTAIPGVPAVMGARELVQVPAITPIAPLLVSSRYALRL